MNNFDAVILDHLIRTSPECANTMMRLNKSINRQVTTNNLLMTFLIDYFKKKIENKIDDELKRSFHVYTHSNQLNNPVNHGKIIGITHVKNNKYNLWFDGSYYGQSHDLNISASTKDAINELSKLKIEYEKIISSGNNKKAKTNPTLDILNDFLLSVPVVNRSHYSGELDVSEFIIQFLSLIVMYVVGSIIENRLGDYWLPSYIVVVIVLLMTLSYYHLYIKNMTISYF